MGEVPDMVVEAARSGDGAGLDPGRLLFAGHPVRAAVRDMERLHAAADVFRSHPDYWAPDAVAEKVTELLRSNRYSIFDAGT